MYLTKNGTTVREIKREGNEVCVAVVKSSPFAEKYGVANIGKIYWYKESQLTLVQDEVKPVVEVKPTEVAKEVGPEVVETKTQDTLF